MKINNLKINNYGKIKNKEINFKNKINIIYGKNEAGKSTLLNFIFNSFYGISKNKKGKIISDYEKFKPLEGEEFSGKIEYELDNNEKFEIYRDFNKKNPKIFNENSEDISKQFNIDKKTGNEFFYDQTKVDEDLFISTVGILQKEVELEKNNQNFLVQKLANLVGTGEDNVSYKRAMDRINKKQLDEVGTDRTREKPINILNKKIEELENKKNKLEEYQNKKYEIAEEENNLLNIQEELKNTNNYFKEIKIFLENEKIEKEKINIKENIVNENNIKINNLKEEL
ncbi:MAG: AAA family ATPase, partial [Clostridia bacterium]|nr:AAA family ATPase [Clostridia bacterium]